MSTVATRFYRHGLRRLSARDTEQVHRAATPLEPFFDLTFVTAFSVAGNQLAYAIAEVHQWDGLLAFCIVVTSIIWAWTNHTWLSSAFDSDDWMFRVLTLMQMAGVLVMAMGIPTLFASIEEGSHFSGTTMILGYVIMRISLVLQWVRVAHDDPGHRVLAISNALVITVAQMCWVMLIFVDMNVGRALWFLAGFWLIEFAGSLVAVRLSERAGEGGSPWHAEHVAERYGLMAIIAIGETVVGTLAAAQEIQTTHGWSVDAVAIIGVGILISFSLWWTYFLLPSGPILHVWREKAFVWAFWHIIILGSIAAVGTGLHVLGDVVDPEIHLPIPTAICAVAFPVLFFMVATGSLRYWLVNAHSLSALSILTYGAPLAAMGAALIGWSEWACLVILVVSPLSVIVGYEAGGWRKMTEQLDRTLTRHQTRDNDATEHGRVI